MAHKKIKKRQLFFLLFGVLFFLTILIVASGYLFLTPALPNVESLKSVHFQTPLTIYTADKKLIAEFGETKRIPVTFSQIPTLLIHAFLSAEDERFYEHPGVDPLSLLRATYQLIRSGRIQSGGSTITMQVARNFFLSNNRVFSRKIREIILSLKIDHDLSKDEILTLYLNKIYLGQRAYGIGAAAKIYYGKNINELTLAEMAMLAGLPKAPSSYNPLQDPSRALIRRNWILMRMYNLGYISKIDYQKATQEKITARHHDNTIHFKAPYIAEYVRQKMIKKYGDQAYTQGYTVYTTIQSKIQQSAQQAIFHGLLQYSAKYTDQAPSMNLIQEGNITLTQQLQALKKLTIIGRLIPAMIDQINSDEIILLCSDHSYVTISNEDPYWKKYSTYLKIGDIVYTYKKNNTQYTLTQPPKAQAALVTINPKNGEIEALVGGFDFFHSKYNRAIQSRRQAASAFKPFIYAAALSKGYTAASLINDAPITYNSSYDDELWRPSNYNKKFNGPTRLRVGLYKSINLISIRLLRDIGLPFARQYLSKFGFSEDALANNLSLALGNVAVSPLQLTRGFAVIANGGYRIQPHLIKKVTLNGQTISDTLWPTVCQADTNQDSSTAIQSDTCLKNSKNKRPAKRVMNQQVNYILNSMLNDVIQKGTGRGAKILKRNDLSGKTGTANNGIDTWFIGFNPEILSTVWVGKDDNTSLGKHAYGATVAAPIWIDFMSRVLPAIPVTSLPRPNGIVTVKIDKTTGLKANINDKNTLFEIFRKNNIPQTTYNPKTFLPKIYDNTITKSINNLY